MKKIWETSKVSLKWLSGLFTTVMTVAMAVTFGYLVAVYSTCVRFFGQAYEGCARGDTLISKILESVTWLLDKVV